MTLALVIAGGCARDAAAPPDGGAAATGTETLVTINADGTQTITRRSTGGSHGEQDSLCAASSFHLYDQTPPGPDVICFRRVGPQPVTIALAAFPRVPVIEPFGLLPDAASPPVLTWVLPYGSYQSGDDLGWLGQPGPNGLAVVSSFGPHEDDHFEGLPAPGVTTLVLGARPGGD